MKEIKEKAVCWWHHRTLRERRAMLMGSLVLMLFIFYQGIWAPCLHHLDIMRKRIVSERSTLLWMQSADTVIQSLSSSRQKPVSLVEFLSQMQQQVRLEGLDQFTGQLKQSENESIDMQFQKVEFDKLMVFLMSVTKKYPVSIIRLSVLATDIPGHVNADIEMSCAMRQSRP